MNRGGGRHGFNRLQCQLCDKYGHTAVQCWHRFDENYQGSNQASENSSTFNHSGRAMISEQTIDADPSISALMAVPETVFDPSWYPDSGATNHITPYSSNMFSKSVYNGDGRIKMANGDTTHIHHTGNSLLFSPKSIKPLFLNNLLHVPSISKNLLSVSQFSRDNRVYFEFHADFCHVKSQDTHQILLEGKL